MLFQLLFALFLLLQEVAHFCLQLLLLYIGYKDSDFLEEISMFCLKYEHRGSFLRFRWVLIIPTFKFSHQKNMIYKKIILTLQAKLFLR